ncbi:hypothetical protein SLS54_001409 [Diplodia seriata]
MSDQDKLDKELSDDGIMDERLSSSPERVTRTTNQVSRNTPTKATPANQQPPTKPTKGRQAQQWSVERVIQELQFHTKAFDFPYAVLPPDTQQAVKDWLTELVPADDAKREAKATSFVAGKTLASYCLYANIVVNAKSEWTNEEGQEIACWECGAKNAMCIIMTPEKTLLALPHVNPTGQEWMKTSTWLGRG